MSSKRRRHVDGPKAAWTVRKKHAVDPAVGKQAQHLPRPPKSVAAWGQYEWSVTLQKDGSTFHRVELKDFLPWTTTEFSWSASIALTEIVGELPATIRVVARGRGQWHGNRYVCTHVTKHETRETKTGDLTGDAFDTKDPASVMWTLPPIEYTMDDMVGRLTLSIKYENPKPAKNSTEPIRRRLGQHWFRHHPFAPTTSATVSSLVDSPPVVKDEKKMDPERFAAANGTTDLSYVDQKEGKEHSSQPGTSQPVISQPMSEPMSSVELNNLKHPFFEFINSSQLVWGKDERVPVTEFNLAFYKWIYKWMKEHPQYRHTRVITKSNITDWCPLLSLREESLVGEDGTTTKKLFVLGCRLITPDDTNKRDLAAVAKPDVEQKPTSMSCNVQ